MKTEKPAPIIKGTSLVLDSGEEARLIPVGSEKAQERRATSIFLATLSIVEQFADAVMKSVGQRRSERTSIQCFTEVVFKQKTSKEKKKVSEQDRPDGLIVLKVGKRTWSALIEAKIGTAQLNSDQIERYLAIAKEHKIDAVITISNQFAVLPTHHPVKVPKNALRSVDLYHWSWTSLLTQAIFQLEIEQTLDPEQRFILNEFRRYFEHPSSGVKSFDAMNSEWKDICLTVKNGGRLQKSADEVKNTVGAWHQEQRDLSLMLTKNLKKSVPIKIKAAHKTDPEARLKDDCADLVNSHCLQSIFKIPGAASDLKVVADLKGWTVVVSMELKAPSRDEKKTTKAQITWLLKQLQKTTDTSIEIVASWPKRAPDTRTSLEELRENPFILHCENAALVPIRYQVRLVCHLGGKFFGSKTFLAGMNKAVRVFYREAGEHLRVWVPLAPKLPKNIIEEETQDQEDTV
jgi:hypothetical protein